MVTAGKPVNAASLGAEPVVYYSRKVFLAMIVTLGQKLGAPEATPEQSAKDSKNIFERRFEYSNEKNLRTRVRSGIGRFERRLTLKDYNACLQGLENNTYRHQSCDIDLVFLHQHH